MGDEESEMALDALADDLLLSPDDGQRRMRARAVLDAIPLFDYEKAYSALHECLRLAIDHYGAADNASAQERLDMKVKLALLESRTPRSDSPE